MLNSHERRQQNRTIRYLLLCSAAYCLVISESLLLPTTTKGRFPHDITTTNRILLRSSRRPTIEHEITSSEDNDDDGDNDETKSSSNNEANRQEGYRQSRNNQQHRKFNDNTVIPNSKYRASRPFRHFDEKDKRELDWVVRNTGKLLGPEAPLPGSMTQHNILLVSSLMEAWARRSSKKESRAPHVVERLLQRLLKERDAGNDLVVIDTSLYNTVLDAWSNSNEPGSAERSEEILLRLEDMYHNHQRQQKDESSNNSTVILPTTTNVKPDEDSYNAVIKAYVKNGNRKTAASKVEAIIARMEDSTSLDPTSSVSKDEGNTNNNEDATSTSRATARPNRRSYNLLLYALANSSMKDAPIRATKILRHMLKRYMNSDGGTRDVSAKPDINSFNQVLGAWARGRRKGFEYQMDNIFKQLLELPESVNIKPNTDTFNAVLGGWLKSRNRNDASQKTREILQIMEDQYLQQGNEYAKPDRVTINTLTAAFAKEGTDDALEQSIDICRTMERRYKIKPDQISNNIVLDSWCKSGRPDAPERVLDLLERMERRFKLNGKATDKPDGYTYSSVIGCFVKFQRQDAPEMGEELLGRMQDLYLNFGGDPLTVSVYNAVLNAWASSQSEYASIRVREILQKMETSSKDDVSIPQPTLITYNTVIKAMSGNGRVEDAEYAEEILKRLEENAQKQQQDEQEENSSQKQKQSLILPDAYSYSSVITAYGRSDAHNKAEKAMELLKRQLAFSSKKHKAASPGIYSFNAALNACAFCGNTSKGSNSITSSVAEQYKRQAFDIALQIYQDLLLPQQPKVKPDSATFGTLLRACASLLPRSDPLREELTERFFQEACESGNVGRLVITQLKFAATPEQHAKLTGRLMEERIFPQELPKAWTRNVKENNNRRA